MILGLSFYVQSWWPRESMLQSSSVLSKFSTSLSKVLTLWHYVKVKQRYYCCLSDHIEEFNCFFEMFKSISTWITSTNSLSSVLISPEKSMTFATCKLQKFTFHSIVNCFKHYIDCKFFWVLPLLAPDGEKLKKNYIHTTKSIQDNWAHLDF